MRDRITSLRAPLKRKLFSGAGDLSGVCRTLNLGGLKNTVTFTFLNFSLISSGPSRAYHMCSKDADYQLPPWMGPFTPLHPCPGGRAGFSASLLMNRIRRVQGLVIKRLWLLCYVLSLPRAPFLRSLALGGATCRVKTQPYGDGLKEASGSPPEALSPTAYEQLRPVDTHVNDLQSCSSPSWSLRMRTQLRPSARMQNERKNVPLF